MSGRLQHLEQRPAAEFENACLDMQDFDGTIADTFEQDSARDIFGVDEAYRVAVEETLPDDKDALKRYEDQGEHRNRTPAEIIESLVPDRSQKEQKVLTGKLIVAKLDVLEGQIGKPLSDGALWPRPQPGFIEYSDTVSKINASGEYIDQAIISAGHASFIEKCLDLYGVSRPEIMITDETIRGLNSRLSSEKLTKPEIAPFMLAKFQWLLLYGLTEAPKGLAPHVNNRISLIGDSEPKDGGLARNAGIEFFHVNPKNPREGWDNLSRAHLLGGQAVSDAAYS